MRIVAVSPMQQAADGDYFGRTASGGHQAVHPGIVTQPVDDDDAGAGHRARRGSRRLEIMGVQRLVGQHGGNHGVGACHLGGDIRIGTLGG
jgi:hypothetical protein